MAIRETVLSFFVGSVLFTAPAMALEWLTEEELEQQCESFLIDDRSRDGALCVAFIQGFLAGAEATDGIVAERVRKIQPPSGDTYEDRALRTRIGSYLQKYGTPYYAGYCIGPNVSSQAVVTTVIDYLNEHPDEPGLTANQAVYTALVESFPCEG